MANRRTSTRTRSCRRAQSRQLLLRSRGKRGGYRAGAGRPSGRSNHYVPHVSRPAVTRHNAVHVTLRVVEGVPSLRRSTPARLVEQVFREERARKGFRLVHYAIRSNHLHLVCEADEQQALSRGYSGSRRASPAGSIACSGARGATFAIAFTVGSFAARARRGTCWPTCCSTSTRIAPSRACASAASTCTRQARSSMAGPIAMLGRCPRRAARSEPIERGAESVVAAPSRGCCALGGAATGSCGPRRRRRRPQWW